VLACLLELIEDWEWRADIERQVLEQNTGQG